jgi:hypothetical protein
MDSSYDSEPVYFCRNCLSLNIKELADIKLDMCGECGNLEIEESTFKEWNELYIKEKGEKYLNLSSGNKTKDSK